MLNNCFLGIFEGVVDVKLYLSSRRDSVHHLEIVFLPQSTFLRTEITHIPTYV